MNDLKVGDLIATSEYGRVTSISKITKVTSSTYFAGGSRFRRKDLLQIGSTSFRGPVYGSVPDMAMLIDYRVRVAGAKLRRLVVTPDNVDAVEAFIKSIGAQP